MRYTSTILFFAAVGLSVAAPFPQKAATGATGATTAAAPAAANGAMTAATGTTNTAGTAASGQTNTGASTQANNGQANAAAPNAPQAQGVADATNNPNGMLTGIFAPSPIDPSIMVPVAANPNSAADQAAAFNYDVATVNNAIITMAGSNDPQVIKTAAQRGFVAESDEMNHEQPLTAMAGPAGAASDSLIRQFTPDVLSGFQAAMADPSTAAAQANKINIERYDTML
jgi:hypothetical protein